MEEETSSSSMQLDLGPSSSTSAAVKLPSPNSNNAIRSSSGGTKSVSSMSKRQQAAHRARMEALSFQLKTRLQYAVFKVEHGWSKQSLSEVENLYYKHRRASGSGFASSSSSSSMNNTAKRSPQAQRSGSGGQQKYSFMPSTPTPQTRTTSPTAVRKQSLAAAEAFGGLVTPPPSGGTLPIQHERYKELSGNHHSFSSGLNNNQQSPSVNTFYNKANQSSTQSSAKTGKSYADFWSKIGSTGNSTENNASNRLSN